MCGELLYKKRGHCVKVRKFPLGNVIASNPMESVGRREQGGAGWLNGRGIDGRLRPSSVSLSRVCQIAGPGPRVGHNAWVNAKITHSKNSKNTTSASVGTIKTVSRILNPHCLTYRGKHADHIKEPLKCHQTPVWRSLFGKYSQA